MANDPNTYSYSSSSVMSYSHDGRGEPKYFQASKSTKRAPGGVSILIFSAVLYLKSVGFLVSGRMLGRTLGYQNFYPQSPVVTVLTGLLIVCKKYWEIIRNFQEVTLCGRKGLLCGKFFGFSGEDFT